MESITFIGAFIAGVLSFLSPCILPLLPAYLSVLTGYSVNSPHDNNSNANNLRTQGVVGAIFFGLGFTIVFILLGATATTIGKTLYLYQGIITKLLGVIVIFLGLHMAGILQLKFLYKEKRIQLKSNQNKKPFKRYIQIFLMGLAFAFGWTPCIGPILGGILTLAAAQNSVYQGVALLSVYSVGLWIPFLITAIFTTPILNALSKRPTIALRASQISGILLVILGILLISGQLTRITSMLA